MSTLRILTLSDFHIGNKRTSYIEQNRLESISNYILARYGHYDEKPVIVVTGDLTENGFHSEFKIVKKIFSDPLKDFTILYSPGNHDSGRLGNLANTGYVDKFKKYFNQEFPYYKIIDGHLFIALDSMKGEIGKDQGMFADGEMGFDQRNWLRNTLKDIKPPLSYHKTIVFFHHHPLDFVVGNSSGGFFSRLTFRLKVMWRKRFDKYFHGLDDHRKLMKLLKNRANIVFFGHRHTPVDFSEFSNSNYNIGNMICVGKSTKKSCVYKCDPDYNFSKGKEVIENCGWLTEIQEGVVSTTPLKFKHYPS